MIMVLIANAFVQLTYIYILKNDKTPHRELRHFVRREETCCLHCVISIFVMLNAVHFLLNQLKYNVIKVVCHF